MTTVTTGRLFMTTPVTAWRFIGGPDLGDGNLFNRPAPGLFDSRLYLFQVTMVKGAGSPLSTGLHFSTHLSEHLPLQPCRGGVQLNYRTPELFYGPALGRDDLHSVYG